MDNISNDIDDLVGDAQQYRVVRAELAAARFELAQLGTLYKTSKNIWETSMTEQGRVIAELREAVALADAIVSTADEYRLTLLGEDFGAILEMEPVLWDSIAKFAKARGIAWLHDEEAQP